MTTQVAIRNGTKICPHEIVRRAEQIFHSGLPFVEKSLHAARDYEFAGRLFLIGGDNKSSQLAYMDAAQIFGNLARHLKSYTPTEAMRNYDRAAFDYYMAGDRESALAHYVATPLILLSLGNTLDALRRLGKILKSDLEQSEKDQLEKILRSLAANSDLLTERQARLVVSISHDPSLVQEVVSRMISETLKN